MSVNNFIPFGDYNKKPLNMEKTKKHLPLELGVLLTRYVDPFIGSGQMFLEVMGNYGMEDSIICDTNPELINVYNQIKHSTNTLIEELSEYQFQFNSGSWKDRHTFYRTTLGKYNYIRCNESNNLGIKRAAMFLFLGETCKIFRNSSENIIAPDYTPEPVTICHENKLKETANCLKNTKILCGDFKECLTYINNKTFLFVNPPPVNSRLMPEALVTDNHNPVFTLKDMKAVESFCKISAYKGAEVFVNPLCKNITYKK
ncbi:MAG: hypothetical protein E7388_03100 [Ruminococcaceae bacterium]|nr:hypothetical protein [Oscillospiraceae bacterium]